MLQSKKKRRKLAKKKLKNKKKKIVLRDLAKLNPFPHLFFVPPPHFFILFTLQIFPPCPLRGSVGVTTFLYHYFTKWAV